VVRARTRVVGAEGSEPSAARTLCRCTPARSPEPSRKYGDRSGGERHAAPDRRTELVAGVCRRNRRARRAARADREAWRSTAADAQRTSNCRARADALRKATTGPLQTRLLVWSGLYRTHTPLFLLTNHPPVAFTIRRATQSGENMAIARRSD